jgi:Domain of unknown function (DUF4926)
MIKLLDTVALTENLPEENLDKGQVGTVVELLDPETYLVEFSDDDGWTYAMLPLKNHQLRMLHYNSSEPEAAIALH